jgi:hypothetical protein
MSSTAAPCINAPHPEAGFARLRLARRPCNRYLQRRKKLTCDQHDNGSEEPSTMGTEIRGSLFSESFRLMQAEHARQQQVAGEALRRVHATLSALPEAHRPHVTAGLLWGAGELHVSVRAQTADALGLLRKTLPAEVLGVRVHVGEVPSDEPPLSVDARAVVLKEMGEFGFSKPYVNRVARALPSDSAEASHGGTGIRGYYRESEGRESSLFLGSRWKGSISHVGDAVSAEGRSFDYKTGARFGSVWGTVTSSNPGGVVVQLAERMEPEKGTHDREAVVARRVTGTDQIRFRVLTQANGKQLRVTGQMTVPGNEKLKPEDLAGIVKYRLRDYFERQLKSGAPPSGSEDKG